MANKKTYREVSEFLNVTDSYLKEHGAIESKFTYALRKMQKDATAKFRVYQEKVEDIDLEHCVEKDGVLVRDARGMLQFSKEGMKARTVAIRVLTEQTIEVSPFIVGEESVPADVPANFRQFFRGFVLAVEGSEEPALHVVEKKK